MAGKKGKSGRKSQRQGPTQHFNTRIDAATKKQLVQEAKRRGRSLSAEIELRLKSSVIELQKAEDGPTRALLCLIAEIAKRAQAPGLRLPNEPIINWRNDRFLAEALRSGINQVLDRLAPAGKVGTHPSFETPEALAKAIVFNLWNDLESFPEEAADRFPRGHFFHAAPRIAGVLGIQRKGSRAIKVTKVRGGKVILPKGS